jgi:hypothetical protein
MTAKLRIVEPPASTQTRWLELSAQIEQAEALARDLRLARRALKVELMSGMGTWGMSDDQVTEALKARR